MTTGLRLDDPQRLCEQLADLAELCVAEARNKGASGSEVGASASNGLSVTVRLGEVETVEYIRDKALGITVFFGHRKGSASTSDFSHEALRETVAAACSIARHTGEDPCAGLADANLMATHFPDLDLHHPSGLDADAAIEMATRADNAARSRDTRITNSDGASVGSHETAHAYSNSHGFTGTSLSTRHSLSSSVIAQDSAGMQGDYWYDTSRRLSDMMPPEDVGVRAADRAVSRLSARQVPTGTYPVLLSPQMATGFFGHFIGAIRGPNLYRKASFLVDTEGEQIFPSGFRIHEQPHLKCAAGSAAFDGEGVATTARDIIADGVLQGYVLNSYSARRLGRSTTANAGGVRNLTIEPGEHNAAALLKTMDKGLLVTELMGMGVNTVTGDYSRGAGGFWIEDGEARFPVQEITIAGNLRSIFAGISAVGSDVDTRGNIRSGSVLLSPMTVAGS